MIDVDGDADLDVIVGFANAAIRLYVQDSTKKAVKGAWFSLKTIASQTVGKGRALTAVLGDVTGDAADEVVLVTSTGGVLDAVAWSAPDQTFTDLVSAAEPLFEPLDTETATGSPRLVAVDYDGDGDLDVVHGHQNKIRFFRQEASTEPGAAPAVGWVLEDVPGATGVSVKYAATPSFHSFALGDVDSDSDVDLVVTSTQSTGTRGRSAGSPCG